MNVGGQGSRRPAECSDPPPQARTSHATSSPGQPTSLFPSDPNSPTRLPYTAQRQLDAPNRTTLRHNEKQIPRDPVKSKWSFEKRDAPLQLQHVDETLHLSAQCPTATEVTIPNDGVDEGILMVAGCQRPVVCFIPQHHQHPLPPRPLRNFVRLDKQESGVWTTAKREGRRGERQRRR